MKRSLFVGDVHGCLEELKELLEVTSYDPSSDELVLLGDLIDRGPSPVETVRYVRKELLPGGAVVIRGNHEDKLGQWRVRERLSREEGRPNGMRPPSPERLTQWAEFTDREAHWMSTLPVILRMPGSSPASGWIAVHAGFESRPMHKQQEGTMMRIRHVHKVTGKPLPMGEDFSDPPDSVPWTAMWRGSSNVVYGHYVQSLSSQVVDEPTRGVLCVGLDTGACFGGRLTAMAVEPGGGREFFSVPARSQYCKIGGGRF